MARVIGLSGELADNIHEFSTVTTVSATAAVEVQATLFTFQHVVTGGNVTFKEQGSLDGTNWYDLADAKTKGAGTFCDHYDGIMARYIRMNVTNIGGNGNTLTTTLACT
jgi:hypothetical protein